MAKHYLDERSSLITSGVVHPHNVERTAFAKLTDGKTIGKRVVIPGLGGIAAGRADRKAPINILEARGSDEDAMSLGVTVLAPKMINTTGLTLPGDLQGMTGERNNSEISDLPTFNWPLIQAVVDWGIGGVDQTVTFDINNGAMINLMASYVRLKATAVNEPNPFNYALVLAGFVGPSNSAPSRARYTEFCGSVNAAAVSTVRNVPAFGRGVNVISRPSAGGGAPTGPNYTITFFQNQSLTAEVARYSWTNTAPGGPLANEFVPLPGSAYHYTITNDSGVDARFYAVWDLAI